MPTISTADEQFAWRRQTALNLHQLVAWVMLRDPLAVERIGDNAGRDAPDRYSQRDPMLRQMILGSEIERVGERRRLELVDAISESVLHLSSGQMPSAALKGGPDGVAGGRPFSIDPIEWQFMKFNLVTGGAGNMSAETDLVDLRFPTSIVLKLWPSVGNVSALGSSIEPQAERKLIVRPRNSGGRPPKWDWTGFWIEAVLWAAANDINEDESCRSALTKHLTEWFANNNGGDTPADSDIRRQLSALYERRRAMPSGAAGG